MYIEHIFENITYTVETPYNTAPYITGSNIARLGHGSQNSWSKLWIPIVKSAPVRVIISPVSEGSGDVMVLRRSRPPPAMVLTR